MQHLRDVRPRHFHPLRQFRLRNAQFLHPLEYPPQKRRSYSIYRFHIFPAVIMDESLSCIWLSPLTAPWRVVCANFAKSSSQVSEPRRRTRNRLCRLYRCLFPLLLNNHKDASGIRRTSICRSRRQEDEAVHHLSSHSAMQSPRCRISGVPDAR